VEEVSISRTLAFSCEHGCSPEEYATMRERNNVTGISWPLICICVYDVQSLASYAEQHVNDTEAPLFLRFINLLINDAIFLLDEALSVSRPFKSSLQKQNTHKFLLADVITVGLPVIIFVKTGPHIETPNTLRGRGMVRRYPSSQSQVWGSIVAPPMESGAVRPGQKTKTILMHFVP